MTRVEAALGELRRYLQDEIAPSAAADSLARLMAQPPDILMQQVGTWSAEQSRLRARPISDLLLHALKKVYIPAELGLLDREAMESYLDRVSTIAIRLCPPDERTQLRNNLTALRMSGDARTTPLGAVPKATLPPPPPAPTEDPRTAKRFSLIMDRLEHDAKPVEGKPAAPPDSQALGQLVTLAAARAQSGGQLNEYLDQLRPLTGGKEGNVFVILGGSMPSWDLGSVGPGVAPPPSQVGAMEKIIDLAEDPAEAMTRFRELVTAAVGKFNEGSLAAAVWMLDVAQDGIAEKKLDIAAVDHIRAEAVEAINAAQLRKYTENRGRHAALRIALGFFPTLSLELLFRNVRGEQRAERRRTLLGFVEAHGSVGRDAAIEQLERELRRPDVDTYYLRNLIYLLHRIPRELDTPVERELEALTRATERAQNIYVVKEAATALGQIKSDGAVKLLTLRLAEYEALLLRNDTSMYPAAEMQKLLDRIVGSLAHIGTAAALLTVARHGMQANPALGDTRARLTALSQHDLSFDAATTTVLLKALREEIPGKLLGRFLPKRQEPTVCLIEALSGTRSVEVEDALRDVAQRFPEQEIGLAAAKVLEKWLPPAQRARGDGAATLAGELEFFGLPAVMQSLADNRATGMLTLRTKDGQAAAKLVIVNGMFVNAQRGPIRGPDALYDMFERPIAGSFAFVPHPPEAMKTELQPCEVLPLVLEGVRRHDELQRVLAFVPDTMRLAKTNVKPSPPDEEDEPALIREVWLKASAGAMVIDCERDVAADAYRVRRLIAHWIEQGALVAM